MTTTERPSAWAAGWTTFAAVMLMVAGVAQLIAGIVAIAEDEFFIVGREWTFAFDVTTWGWVHLIVGLVLLLSGAGVLTGNVLARTVGVAVAALSILANFAFLPWYPVWAVVIIAIDIAVIWALTAHGRDAQTALDG